MRPAGATIVLVLVACAAGAGCGNASAARNERIDGQTIMPVSRTRLPTEPYSPVDQPGQLRYDDARAPRDPQPQPRPGAERPSPAVAQALDRAIPPLAARADPEDPATGPATARALPPGSYMTIGGVVAEVNGVAIYADKVVSDIEPLLAPRARELGEAQFRKLATKELSKQITANINNELLVAAADRLLDEKDKEQAKVMAEQWRQREITRAGGSVEAARRRFAAQGRSFDDDLIEEHRRAMGMVLVRKEIVPKIHVMAAEMRQYYEANKEKEYTVRDAAQFDLIQVDPVKVGDHDRARQRIEDLRARAVGGADFTELAKQSNGPPMRDSAGELTWIERNAFAISAVEEAVWRLQPGEVTPVIEDGGRFYIAKLEQKRLGRVLPFEEEATQDNIRAKLWNREFTPLYNEMLERLRRQSIVRADPEMMQSALEIAMQRYPAWAGK